MKVISSKIEYEINLIVIKDNKLSLGTTTLATTTPWRLLRFNDLENLVDLNYLAKQIEKIKKKLKLEEINFLIEEAGEGMYIEIHYSNEGKVNQADIHINYNFLSSIDEEDAIIFACHEIGHLLDAQNLIRHQKFFSTWDIILKPLSILFLAAIFFVYFQDHPPLLQMIEFLGLVTLIFGGISLTKNILRFWLQRNSEYRADALAVKVVGDLDAVINALTVLKEIEEIPVKSNLFSSHPTLNQRIKALKARFWYKILLKNIWS